MLDFAEKYSATFFDIEDVEWSDCGELCTFDVLVDEFGLLTKPLKQLVGIVRGADINHHDFAPEAAGLLAASLGLSGMYRDDLAQLNTGMALYSAFYRWCRMRLMTAMVGHPPPASTHLDAEQAFD